MHYVIGDVHGCYDQMIEMIETIEKEDPDAKFIFVGDFVDRGPKVWETLDWCLENINTTGNPETKFRSVLGNHENTIIEWFYAKLEPAYDAAVMAGKEKYFEPPMTHYDFSTQMEAREYYRPDDVRRYIEFFRKLPLFIEMEINGKNYIIAHAWFLPDKPDVPVREEQEAYLWDRFAHGYGNHLTDDIIIHGHTPTIVDDYYYKQSDQNGKICYRHNEINVDGGCVFNQAFDPSEKAWLCGYCIETGKEYYVPGPTNRNEDGVWI